MVAWLGSAWATKYQLVTSADQLVAGAKYIIANGTSGDVYVISTESNTNNRKTTTATVSNSQITSTDAMMVFKLGGASNAWTFTTTNYSGTNGFLYNKDTSNNRLFVGDNTETNKFTITFSNNEITSITCNGNTSKGVMCFNGTLVACYGSKSSSYKVPQLYKEVEGSSDSDGGNDSEGTDDSEGGNDNEETDDKVGDYVLTNLSDIRPNDDVIITMTNATATYAMANNKGTTAAPTAVKVTVSNNRISEATDDIIWYVTSGGEGTYNINVKGGKTYLYCTNTNNGVRVGTGAYYEFLIKDNYLYEKNTTRYLGVYNSADFRCYTSINTNISGQTLAFYVKKNNEEVPPSTPEEKGYYAVVSSYDGKYYAMSDDIDSKKLIAVEVYSVNGKVVNVVDKEKLSWVKEENGGIKDMKGNYLNYTKTDISFDTNTQNYFKEVNDDNGVYWLTSNSDNRALIYRDQAFKTYAVTNANASGYGSIGYLMTFSDGYVRPNLTEGKIGTICLEHTIENVANISGAKFYSIAGKHLDAEGNPTSLVLEEETNGLLGGYPYIFIASATDIVIAYEGDADATSAENNNGLYGSLEDMDVAEGMYLVSGNKIQKCGTGCSIAANRAYINMAEVPEYNVIPSAKTLTISFDYATSINAVSVENSNSTYSLTGIRVDGNKLERGIYIKNGKKIFVK